MLIYVIDAFNFIHSVQELSESIAPHVDLIRYIKANHLTGSRTNHAVIIFDGYPKDEVLQEREFEVLFSKSRTADDVIREYLLKSKHPRQIVVVSDDNAVRGNAAVCGAKALSNSEFCGQKKKPRYFSKSIEEELPSESQKRITEEFKRLWVKEK